MYVIPGDFTQQNIQNWLHKHVNNEQYNCNIPNQQSIAFSSCTDVPQNL